MRQLVRIDVESARERDERRAVAVAVHHLRSVPERVVVRRRVVRGRLDRRAGVVVRVAAVHVLVVVVNVARVVVRRVDCRVTDVRAAFGPLLRAGERRAVVRTDAPCRHLHALHMALTEAGGGRSCSRAGCAVPTSAAHAPRAGADRSVCSA